MVPDLDNRFGPQLVGHFDFTLLFGQIFFEIVPATLMILATPFYAKEITGKASQQIKASVLLWAKMAVGASLLSVSIAKTVLWQVTSELQSSRSTAASVLSLIAAICALVVLYGAHLYNKRLSGFISLFFTLTMLLDLSLVRTYFLRYDMGLGVMRSIGVLQIVALLLKLFLVVLEEVAKTPLDSEAACDSIAPSDSRVGFWNRVIFFWVNSLLAHGFSHELDVGTLPQLDEQFDSRMLFDKFSKHWAQYSSPKGTAGGLVGATVLIYGGLAVSQSIYARNEYQIKVSIRGILTVALYDKMQRIRADDAQSAAAVTLMTTDVLGVEQIVALLHETWVITLELALGVYILYQFIGAACFLVFIPSLVAAIATFYTAKAMTKYRGEWNEKISSRIQATSALLKQLKDIKAMGLSHSLSEYLQQKRTDEIKTSLKERRTRIVMFALGAFNYAMTPVIVLGGARFWTRSTPQMSAAEIFSAYSVILIVSTPLDLFFERIILWASSYACITRIQEYLVLPEQEDSRQCMELSGYKHALDEKKAEHDASLAVDMENVTVQSGDGREVLKGVSIGIPASSLVMVHGTVGSGKSVFLQTILGDTKPASGRVSISSRNISFAAQKPWLRNQTIRQNIIGPNEFDDGHYRAVIHGCALDIDIAQLPSGDETMTGTDGCNLSGGQKQRLGLARSLFAPASIAVLDDVLSALDTQTASIVFGRLFGPDGLARRRGITVIMATNREDLLYAADIVLKMNGDGTIAQQRATDFPTPSETTPFASTQAPTCHKTEAIDDKKKTSIVKSKTVASDPTNDKMRRNGDKSLYVYFVRAVGPYALFIWLATCIIASVVEQMPQIFIKIWYSVAPGNDLYFVGFAMMALANIVCTSLSGIFFFVKIVPNISNELHFRLLLATVGSTLAWITQTDDGITLNRYSQDISIVSQRLPIVLMQLCFIFWSTVTSICIFAAAAKYTAPIMLLLLAVLYGLQYFYLRTSRQLRLLELETSAPLLTLFQETSSGARHIRAFRWQKQFMADCCRLVDRMQKPYYYLFSVQRWLALVLDVSTCLVATILISVSTALPSSTTGTSVGLALITLLSFSSLTNHLVTVWVMLETCLGGLARIRTFCDTTPQETDDANAPTVPDNWPSSGKIEIDAVSASYEYEDGTLHQALDNASVVIEHGEKAGIVGRTGSCFSGKSSLFLALLHMIECSGTVRIDGRDISTVPRELLRSRITTLTQDGVEVSESIRFNMFPFAESKPDDESILGMLDLVDLGQCVRSQGGLDADMASLKLTPGQKQLFFVARGILHHTTLKTKLVMMDEATSSMDYGVDKKIQELIDGHLNDCTVFLIAHRLHSLDNADVVVKLEAGKVIEVTRRGGKYGTAAGPER
ncbi:hypothetical protein PWT90_03231 [Aphanocladium album]|nr:hypothetical protein PWT90_03231 [Aphanocladium album]